MATFELTFSECDNAVVLVDNRAGCAYNLADYFIPSEDWIKDVKAGDAVPNPFGREEQVTEITARGVNCAGFGYVCLYTRYGPSSTISGSFTAGQLHRSLRITGRHTSADLTEIERLINKGACNA
jgi:hypothetical protein